MAFTLEDKKWTKKAIIDGVVGGINQVVIPVLEGLNEKVDKNTKELKKVSKKVYIIEAGLSRVERKLDQVTDHHADKLDEHKGD